jgi:uroporphyrin-3 C-methyltransferase
MTTPQPIEPAEPVVPADSATSRPWYLQPAVAIAVAAALLLTVQWYGNHQQTKTLQAELAQRFAATEQVRDNTREAQAKLDTLEAKQHESQGQQVALESMYQELARSRDESLLAEIEQTLLVANQQIQVAGNVRSALVALQSVDARLARLDRPQFAAVRTVIARDIERLKLAPRVDPAAIAARLDEVAASVDGLPLLIEARPSDAPAARKQPLPAEDSLWLRFAREFWQDVRDIVRIEKIDNADTAPLAPSQAYFLRENLRLRLLGARLALLARNEKSYRADLKAARDWLTRYFDVRKDAVTNALASVRQLHDGAISVELPDVTTSLDAVRNFRATRERR